MPHFESLTNQVTFKYFKKVILIGFELFLAEQINLSLIQLIIVIKGRQVVHFDCLVHY